MCTCVFTEVQAAVGTVKVLTPENECAECAAQHTATTPVQESIAEETAIQDELRAMARERLQARGEL